ncbi:MAG: hypothetical protein FWG87_13775 [Defluviitaleaceae bacterium]|nr:hypothetical protein [Defluviitaleaceae bacterium]
MTTLQQAREVAELILDMTKALEFTQKKENEEAEITVYALAMDEREPLVYELADLREQMGEEEIASPEFAQVEKIVAEIIALDKGHLAIMEKMRSSVQASYKGVKQGQRITAGYNPLHGSEISDRINITH